MRGLRPFPPGADLNVTFAELFQQVESPSSVGPRTFTTAMKKAESVILNRYR